MGTLPKLGFCLTAMTIVAAAVLLSQGPDANARPYYLEDFKATYPDAKSLATETKCGICHEGESKKNRNAYGKAFLKAMGVKKAAKGDAKIKKGLEKVAKEKSAVDGKTYGDLIAEDKAPASN